MKIKTGARGPGGKDYSSVDASILESPPAKSQRPTADPRTGKQRWIKFYLADWIIETGRLSASNERHALRLCLASVAEGGPLRDSPNMFCNILSLSRWQWTRVREELIHAKFIRIEGDTIVVPFAQTAIATFERRSTVNRQNALERRIVDDIEGVAR